MTTQIKITELTNIGNSLNQNTLVPVVNMAGTPTTQKANLQIVGNLILNNAGNGFPSANSSIYSQSVTNAAQPNITSVGTLTSLTVAGNVNLGGVANVKILGGAIGQVLTTDGAGNLSWAADGTSYGNSNVASYLPTYTGNLTAGNISVTGNISANNIGNIAELNLDGNTSNILYGNGVFAASPSVSLTGDGGNLSNINGANVSGTVPNAEFANSVYVEAVSNNFSYHVVLTTGPNDYTLHNDIDDDFQYNPADGILTVTRVDATYFVGNLAFAHGLPAGNVTGLGNIAGINLNGNGNQVLGGNGAWVSQTGGGGGNLGNVTFDDVTVQGVNQLNLSAGPDYTANLAYVRVRAGDVASHIHMDTGNNEAYDLIVGDDQNFVQVSSTGNIIMSSYDSNTSQYIWTLDTTGNLILAGGNSVIQSVANSSLDPVNPNVSTMILTPDANYSSQSLVLDPTSPGHIHLRAPGTNIEEPLANLFLGGENSSFEVGVYNGSAPNLFIHSGGNTWTFDNTGVLSVPNNINFNGGGIYQAIDEDFVLRVQDADDDGYGINLEVDEGAGTVLSRYDQTRDQFSLEFPNTSKYYQFNDDGKAVFPGNIHGPYGEGFNIEIPGANVNSFITIRTVDNTDTLKANVTVDSSNVSISTANAAYTWTFGNDGNLTTSSNLVIGPGPIGGSSVLQYNDALQIVGEGANAATIMGWAANQNAPDSIAVIAMNSPFSNGASNVLIAVGNNATTVNYWNFDNTGVLTVPGNIVGTGIASPAPYISGFSSIETFDGANIAGFVFDTSNLTLPGNSVAINFANGSAAFANLVQWTTAPVANTSAGTAGQAAYDTGGNLYVCVSTNTWAKFTGTTSW